MRHRFTFEPRTVFWALVGVLVLNVSTTLLPWLIPALRADPPVYAVHLAFLSIAFVTWVAFFVLGLALIVLVVKKKEEGLQGLLKKSMLLTGASAVGYLPSVLLHNAVGGLFGVEEPFFFALAVFVCPLGFLVGVIGTIVLLLKEGRRQ